MNVIYEVRVKRDGQEHYNLVGGYKIEAAAEEVKKYYEGRDWVSGVVITPRKVY